MDGAAHRFFAPCPRGLEDLLRDELLALGAREATVADGGVGCAGPFELCYRANLESRIASRVLWRVGSGAYRCEQDLYEAAFDLPWPDWFTIRQSIKVKVSATRSPLRSLDFITLRIKDAVCDRFVATTGRRPTVDTRRPDIRIDAYLDRDRFILYLDTSGEPLFKRGLRRATVEAPLRENLAAGLLKLSGWDPSLTLLDPMCGGGTILMEAALMGMRVAPGLGRQFAFEQLRSFDARRWQRLCEESRSRQAPDAALAIYGCDRSEKAVHAAQMNLRAAGLDRRVQVTRADLVQMTPPAETGLLITNPPYGVRTGTSHSMSAFYPRIGDALKQRFPGWRAYFFTADLSLAKLIGLAASRRTLLFNGALECRLFEFKIVRGSMRRIKAAAGPV